LLILTLTSHSAFAQIFDSEQNPPGLKWRQINTENFQIIYPSELDSEAKRLSGMLDELILKVSASLKKQPRKISIILQNQGTSSNGFVQLAPRRSEFFTTPPQEFDYQNWINSLAVHELRHVVQFDKLAGGFKAPFFEGLALAIFGITLPPWFYEGDAVGTETSLTDAGRGRQPQWEMAFRTNTLSGKKYSYSKDFIGSLKNFTPGYYQLGYFMTTKLRRDNGAGIMDSIFRRMSGNYLRPYNLSNSIKKYTGLSTSQLHQATVQELQTLWQQQLVKAKPLDYPVLNSRKSTNPVSYLLPAVLPSGEIIALKRSFDKLPAIITIDQTGTEHILISIGPQEDAHFSYSAGIIVWDEFRYDKRFQKRSYNVINRFDIETKRYKQITHRSRMFAPSLSPDGKIIVAVDISYSNEIRLVELDAETGKELKHYNSPGNFMLQTPRFDPTGKKIIVVAVDSPGKAIYELDRATATFKELLPFQHQLISRPVYANGQVIFKAHYNGIDNIYLLNPDSKQLSQITSSKFGAFNPFYDGSTQKLLFNNYQVNGYDISSVSFDKASGTKIPENGSIHYEQPLVAQEGNINVFDHPANLKYESKPYREVNNLFYFHSLIPIAEEGFYNEYNLGLKMQSDNKLNTLSFYGGYQYDQGLKKSEYLAGFSYKRFYPILDITYLNSAQLAYQNSSSGDPIPITWRNNETDADITVPFVFNRLNKIYSMELKTGTSYIRRYEVINRPSNFNTTINFPIRYQFNLRANTRRTALDLAPKWGQNIAIGYRNFPLTNQITGELFSIRTNLFFPGILTNHSFQTSFNYQHGNGIYDLIVDIPRISGYDNLRPTSYLRNTLLLDYRFPLFYPDWEIGPLAYVKRFKGGFFADFENIGKDQPFSPRTFGAELRADMNLLRFYLPLFDVAGKVILVNEKPRQKPIFEFGITYSY
jgi:hypothetical protein